jgi:hypothetical protein
MIEVMVKSDQRIARRLDDGLGLKKRLRHSLHRIRKRGNPGGDGCHNRQKAITIADVIFD